MKAELLIHKCLIELSDLDKEDNIDRLIAECHNYLNQSRFIAAFAVYDLDENGHTIDCQGYYSIKDEAIQHMKYLRTFDKFYTVEPVTIYWDGEDCYVMENDIPIDLKTIFDKTAIIKQQALAKLTDKERKALGF